MVDTVKFDLYGEFVNEGRGRIRGNWDAQQSQEISND